MQETVEENQRNKYTSQSFQKPQQKSNPKLGFTHKQKLNFRNYTENVPQSALMHGRICTWIMCFPTFTVYNEAFAVFTEAGSML